jgi:hypothetical protein
MLHQNPFTFGKGKGVEKMNQELQRYVYQKEDIKDFIFNKKKVTGEQCCGAACASMVSGDDPQVVAEKIGPNVPDTTITGYLTDEAHGWKAELITSGGNEANGYTWTPTQKDFDKINAALDAGKIILWHFPGHYTLCTGINEETNNYIFSDPAGDRRKKYFNTGGKNVEYSKAYLTSQQIKPIWGLS